MPPELPENRREKRPVKGLRRGEHGAGEPGRTLAAHAEIAVIEAERGLPIDDLSGLRGFTDGTAGKGWVGRFF